MTLQLAYQDVATDGHRPAVLVLHRETQRVEDVVHLLSEVGARRVVAPYGDYSVTPSGMEVGGLCWYRQLPGYDGADPISLAKAVVQVRDLLDGLGDRAPHALVGFGQGAVVAVACALLGGPTRSVACVDVHPGHLGAVPSSRRRPSSEARAPRGEPGPRTADPRPGVLVGATARGADLTLPRDWLGAHGADVTTWVWDGSGEHEAALAKRLGLWLDTQAPSAR